MTIQAPSAVQDDPDDILVIERNDPPRSLVGMRGHYNLEGWRDAEGNVRQFECEILKISPHMIKFTAPVTGAVGNRIVVYFEHLGRFEGHVVQVQQRVLTMKIFGTHDERVRVAGKLAWITDSQKAEERRHPRMIPASPESTVSLAGEAVVPCEVIDYSAGGAAVYADVSPPLGSVVTLGKVLSRVVRQFGGGFAVAFMAMQNPQSVESAILQPMPTCEPK